MRKSSESSSLPKLAIPCGPSEIVEKLDRAARKGKLAGFQPDAGQGLFLVDAWGTPFDADLVATASESHGRTELSFHTRLRRKMPIIFALTLAFTVWPGVILTDSVLKLWFDSYYALSQREIFQFAGFDCFTYLWYLPLTIIPLPWVWRTLMRRSRASIHDSALEMIGKMATELGVPISEAPGTEAGKSDS